MNKQNAKNIFFSVDMLGVRKKMFKIIYKSQMIASNKLFVTDIKAPRSNIMRTHK